MLLCTSSSVIAEWLCYWTCNPETWVRFPEGMTSFDFTWNKNYTDTRSAQGKMPYLFFSMILHVFLSQPLQGQNLKKIYGTQKWQKTMGNFRREFREHRKISVDRLCSFGIYYLVSSAWASSIFEKSLYLFIISILIILSSIEVLILYVLCYCVSQAPL